ncbi:MAG: hypothetical protein A4E52_00171 [Pelotomaculum sp. PtaB.Bin013]|nr:MAG: hypothetical protein A4E52_00171 [Pelotomaculum sp. PtaB.Bin013]
MATSASKPLAFTAKPARLMEVAANGNVPTKSSAMATGPAAFSTVAVVAANPIPVASVDVATTSRYFPISASTGV